MDIGTAMGAGWSSGISVYGVVALDVSAAGSARDAARRPLEVGARTVPDAASLAAFHSGLAPGFRHLFRSEVHDAEHTAAQRQHFRVRGD